MNHRSEYSPLKAFHHRQRIDLLRDGKVPGPVHVQIVPTNRCNQNCSFCAYRSRGYSSSKAFDAHDEIPAARLMQLAAECKRLGVCAVEITGGGEPTIHPAFADFCTLLANLGIEYGVVSNGVAAGKPHIANALSGATWVRFSLDAAEEATYATTRRAKPETLARVREHIRQLAAVRLGQSGPLLGVGCVVTRDNWREVYDAARAAKDDGADNIRISAVFQNEGAAYFDEFRGEAAALCRRAKAELQDEQFTVFDLFSDRLSDLDAGPPTQPGCLFQELVTYLGADCNLYRCCVVAYNRLGWLGDVADVPLDILWHSGQFQRRLRHFDARQCPRCMHTQKNATLRYAINPNPRHVNFL